MRKNSLMLIGVLAGLLWAGAVQAKLNPPPLTCAQRQSLDVGVLTLGQQLCTADLTKNGCDASVCSLGLDACDSELATCNSSLTTATTDYDSCTGNLTTETTDYNTCENSLTTETTEYTACNANLSTETTNYNTCESSLAAAQQFPATGQTTVYAVGVDDGAIQAGAALSYTDNGDGTITDNNTKLMWEKKDQSGGLHDEGNSYPWGGTCQDNSTPCGTAADCTSLSGTATCTPGSGAQYTIFQWVAQLNMSPCFANHCDWRIANVKELQSILDYENSNPTVDTAFNTNCTSACTVTTCSCTKSAEYWSSTTFLSGGLLVGYTSTIGLEIVGSKTNAVADVRAVRGGS
jgi:hypothetical protein